MSKQKFKDTTNKVSLEINQISKDTIDKVLQEINQNLIEREEAVAMSLLGALSHQNVFMLGLPGVGKSLIARRIASVFEGKYFEYLMNKFSAPEDLFGPVSITALKNDTFSRKIDGFLPDAEFAFLDEIWKSSPAILNSLLTISNERKYKNGVENIDVPLSYIISASNETPPPNQGLDALYDRFPIRIYVAPIENTSNRTEYLKNSTNMEFKPEHKLKISDIQQFNKDVSKIQFSNQALEAFMACIDECLEKGIYISDRRQKQIITTLKYAALYSGQEKVDTHYLTLLRYFLWDKEEDRETVEDILKNVLEVSLTPENFNLAAYKEKFDETKKYIESETVYQKDVPSGKLIETEIQDRYSSKYNCYKINDKLAIRCYDNELWSLNGGKLYQRLANSTITENTETIKYDGKTYTLPREILHKKGDPKSGILAKTVIEMNDKTNKFKDTIDKAITEYSAYSEDVLKAAGNFIKGEAEEKLEHYLDENKALLASLKIDIEKLFEKVKQITTK
ncbi:MAG: hypothetical protein ATN35_01840 [Epulopiscium sp. Nele67-Bin004]|nr:MAG: hypothetical protein ATN35_01840 [Epulopiscium sp. Nele67-Bin004]